MSGLERDRAGNRQDRVQAAWAELYDLVHAETRPVSLVLLCRPFELDGVLAGLPGQAGWTDDVAILLDAQAAPPRAVAVPGFAEGAVRVAARPLEGDFAAQRNALQRLARHPWMLQLDADESLAPATGRLLPALAAMAEAGPVRSIGLGRENRIDGVPADAFPDVTPAILALNLGLSFAALCALCLSLNRHHAESLGTKPSGRRVLLLRGLGWTGLGLCLIVAGEAEGWGFGPVQWIGAVTGAGVGLVLLLSYRPRLVATAGFTALGLAMAAGALLRFA